MPHKFHLYLINTNIKKILPELFSKKIIFIIFSGSEERKREAERRKSEFERKKSTFSAEKSESAAEEAAAIVPARRIADRIRVFSGPITTSEEEEEADRKREEEEQRRHQEFLAKRGVFS